MLPARDGAWQSSFLMNLVLSVSALAVLLAALLCALADQQILFFAP